ncbi:Protein kinase [Boothiomyces sp. JEL0838]|nr:Protein kinase [Boothiomyces sp. JEL0838]
MSIKQGYCKIKEDKLRSFLWTKRWLVLYQKVLTVNKSESSQTPLIAIHLNEIEKCERTDSQPFCIEISTKDKTIYLSFKSDMEVYDWIDEM